MQDAKKVIQSYGYNVEQEDGLDFPENAVVNRDFIAEITTDLIVARYALEQYLNGSCKNHPSVESVFSSRMR